MDIMCEKHDGTISTWLCIDHAISFCKSCMEKEHRKCSGLRKRTERHTHDKPVSIAVKESLEQNNRIVTICVLPNGEYLAQFATMPGYELCKLNKTFHTVARCDLLGSVNASMCYIGNNKVAFNLSDNQLQFINVKNLHILEQKVTLIGIVRHLACHGEKIYAFNGRTVFSYTIDEIQVRRLCELPKRELVYIHMERSMTVSDNGDFIYCTNQSGHVYQVDSSDGNVVLELNLHRLQVPQNKVVENNSLSVKSDFSGVEINLNSPVDVCYLGNGTVIVFDSEGHIIQIESHGDYSIQTINEMKRNSIITFISTIYDRSTSSLIAIDGGTIKIFRVT
ncbi:uncharacterized protein LOC132739820 [Ruditapes philippinarum]|uniref:uncharacterized protein LOC132739820 n=1 Tax=Ruditapes philippinarum TaxID=129788 RepID=UPI00295BE5B3|nr:uncharacterized protein LOC132739820 [Ruditapes philippinarum]